MSKATGSQGSSSSTSVRRESGNSSPKSPIPMSTASDGDGKFHDSIQILSETILSPKDGRGRDPTPTAVSSLKLEMSQANYMDKDKESLKKKVQDQEHQERTPTQTAGNRPQIDYEQKKVDILMQESTLNADISERIRGQVTATATDAMAMALEPVPVPVPAPFPEITDEMERVINNALNGTNDSEVLATAFNIQITRADLKTLKPPEWLNGNVINTYLAMIAERSRRSPGLPSVHVFTTYFYPKLQKEGYTNILKRWTRKVDLFSFDLIMFPIHVGGNHWCLVTADLRKKGIKFYDSLLGSHMNIAMDLLNYLASEMMERRQRELNVNEWSVQLPKDIPTQENKVDCGVFSCKFAEYGSRGAPFTFKQENMNYFRKRMVYEIIKQDLMHP